MSSFIDSVNRNLPAHMEVISVMDCMNHWQPKIYVVFHGNEGDAIEPVEQVSTLGIVEHRQVIGIAGRALTGRLSGAYAL